MEHRLKNHIHLSLESIFTIRLIAFGVSCVAVKPLWLHGNLVAYRPLTKWQMSYLSSCVVLAVFRGCVHCTMPAL